MAKFYTTLKAMQPSTQSGRSYGVSMTQTEALGDGGRACLWSGEAPSTTGCPESAGNQAPIKLKISAEVRIVFEPQEIQD